MNASTGRSTPSQRGSRATNALRALAALAFLMLSASELRAATVNLAWDPSTDPSAIGYVLSYGTQSRSYTTTIDVGHVTSWSLDLPPGQRYYFAAQAYDSVGNRSDMSNEVFVDLAATPAPSVTSLSPTSGPVGTAVTINGANFGATQGMGNIKFNGTLATPSSWSASSLVVSVPNGATTGNVVVTANSQPSNGVPFTVTTAAPAAPSITSVSPGTGPVGATVTIAGSNFGSTQGTSSVRFNGTAATPTSWSATSIAVPVPSGATTGNVVVTVNGAASNGAPFTVTTATLPAPWQTQDVGNPAITGQATASGGSFSVTGAGVDIWDASDQFRFVYQTMDGDGQIVARVDSLQVVNEWSKAGVMIRADLTASAANAMAGASGTHGMLFQSRVSAGGTSTNQMASGAMPRWVRLVRSGNTLTGYQSADGTTWTQINSATVPLPTHVYVGLAVTSHLASRSTTASFSNVTVTGTTTP